MFSISPKEGRTKLRGSSTPIELENQRRVHAGRAGNAFVCSNCRAPLNPKRGSRRQLYCSYWCRDEARRARNFAVSATTRRGSPAIPRPVQNNGVGSTACKGDSHGPASGVVGPHVVIEIEIVGRRNWREVVSVDGVRAGVAQLSREALT